MGTLSKLNGIAGRVGCFLQPFLILVLRLFWGYGFFQAGLSKFLNMTATIQGFTAINIPFPEISSYLAASVELVGGALIFFGLFSRLASIPLVFTMIIAYTHAHSESLVNLLQNPQNFIDQAPFNFLLTALIVWCFGPGYISIDGIIGKKK